MMHANVLDFDISEAAKTFCRERDCEAPLRIAIEIAQESFTMLKNLSITLEHDDEVDMQMVVIEVKVRGSVNRILDEYDQYTEKWVTAVSWPERSHFRLLYNIVAP